MAGSGTGYPNGGVTPQGFDLAQLAQEVAKQVGPMIFSMLSAQPQPATVAPYAAAPQLAPQGIDFGQIAQEIAKQVGPIIFSMLSAQPQMQAQFAAVSPFGAAPQLTPQGFNFGQFAQQFAQHAAPIAAQVVQHALPLIFSMLAAQPQMQAQSAAVSPFGAAPQLTPQGFNFGQFAQHVAPIAGQVIQHALPLIFSLLAAQPQMQAQSAGVSPYGAAPQLTPQGFNFGQFAQHVAPIAGQVIQHALPLIFSLLAAQPQMQAQSAGVSPYGAAPQLSPQGTVGNLLGGLAPGLGQTIGGAFGQGQLGGQIGNLFGGLGSLLPFQAAPQLTPQGFNFGQFAQHVAPIAGQVIQHALPLIFSLLAAQPQMQPQSAGVSPYGAAPQLTPQGTVGNLLGGLAPGLGQTIGGAFGQGQLGGQIGNLFGGLGSLLPFQAAPQLTPQGFNFGQFAQHVAPIAGQVIQHALPLILSLLAAQPQMQPQSAGVSPFGAAPQLAPMGFGFGGFPHGPGPVNLGGDFDEQHVWHDMNWWRMNRPDWVRVRHPEWGVMAGPFQAPSNVPGDFDENHIWHPREWWMQNRLDWVRGRHPEWFS